MQPLGFTALSAQDYDVEGPTPKYLEGPHRMGAGNTVILAHGLKYYIAVCGWTLMQYNSQERTKCTVFLKLCLARGP